MKAIQATLFALCGSLAVGALATDADPLEAEYEEFLASGVFDPELSNAKADEMVARGYQATSRVLLN